MYKLGWFSTGRSEGSQRLLRSIHDCIEAGEISAEIEFVFCSREPGEAELTDVYLKLVEDYGIPLVYFSYQNYRRARGERTPPPGTPMPQWRIDYDREVMSRIKDFQPDLCILAGFMLIFGEEMCQKYNIINLHPASPHGPTGIWQNVIWELIESGARESGVMMHLVIPELDRGPVVTYCTYPIRGEPFDHLWEEWAKIPVDSPEKHSEDNPLFKTIRQHGFIREIPLIITTIRAFSEGRVKVSPNKQITDDDGKPISGYDLTTDIEEYLRKKGA
ncbi:MAG TPA: phosphoglycerate transporter [Dehalococcoidia bacterium]|nr:phosphoglycerate transporter [Dehalococcoidia bacterium]